MTGSSNIPAILDERRRRLGLSCAALAQRASLSLRTVQRVCTGAEADPALSTIVAIAKALGLSLRFDEQEVQRLRRKQAEQKATRIVALVQGTSALEAQAVPASTLRDLRDRTINELLAGPSRKLWAE